MPSTSTTVDLSRLPAPELVEQLSYEAILAAMVADLRTRLPTFDATVESDPAVKVLQVAAYRELLLRRTFDDRARQLLVAYATGANLDALAAIVGVSRLVLTPANPQTGAAAVYESDDDLRQRVVLAPEGFSVAGPELAYVAHAKAASAQVLDASATSPAPGEVRVTVLSRAGSGIADAALLAAVTAAVTADDVRPIGDAVTVAGAALVPAAITAALTTFAGPDVSLVLATARASLDTYLADNRLLGRDLNLSAIYAALSVAGVEKVVLASPDADVVCSPLQAAQVTAITLTHAGYA